MSLILLSDTVISSRIRLARNIRNIPLPYKLRKEYSEDAALFLNRAFAELRKNGEYNIRLINKMSEAERLSLIERHLISKELFQSGWGSAVAINKAEDISVMFNEEDHIRSQCIMEGLRLNRAYSRLNELDNTFLENFDIAFDERYGFLTGCLTNVGTGMRSSVMLFLPAMTIMGSIKSVFDKLTNEGIIVRGAYGEGTKATSYMYQVSNRYTLGITEHEIIRNVTDAVRFVVEQEKRTAERLLQSNTLKLKDRIMRSLGTLIYACSLELSEFITCFCDVKLGINLGYIDLKKEDGFNSIIDKAQSATLSFNSGIPYGKEELNEERARCVSKWLKERLGI